MTNDDLRVMEIVAKLNLQIAMLKATAVNVYRLEGMWSDYLHHPTKYTQEEFNELVKEARENVVNNRPRKYFTSLSFTEAVMQELAKVGFVKIDTVVCCSAKLS